MTEEEWKTFDKAKGTTVYVKQLNGCPVPWQIESHYPRGATLSRIFPEGGKHADDQKYYTAEPYQRIMTEEEGKKRVHLWEENRRKDAEKAVTEKTEGRACIICGKRFKPRQYNQTTCSDECRKVKDRNDHRKRRETCKSKTCVVCGKQFIPRSIRQITCSTECGKKRQADVKKIWLKNLQKEQRARKEKEQKND